MIWYDTASVVLKVYRSIACTGVRCSFESFFMPSTMLLRPILMLSDLRFPLKLFSTFAWAFFGTNHYRGKSPCERFLDKAYSGQKLMRTYSGQSIFGQKLIRTYSGQSIFGANIFGAKETFSGRKLLRTYWNVLFQRNTFGSRAHHANVLRKGTFSTDCKSDCVRIGLS